MSRRLQDLFWDLDLTSTEQLVAQRLAWHADDATGKCWPGIASLCAKTGLGERAVQNAIKSLVAKGHITRDPAPGVGTITWVHPRISCGSGAAPPVDPAQDDATGSQAPAADAGGKGQRAPHDVHPRTNDTPAPDAGTPARRAPKQVKKPSNDHLESAEARRERQITGQRGRRIDIDWQPSKPLPAEIAKVVDGWPPGRLAEEASEFRDFWISEAGQRASKLDWDATWWNRLRELIRRDRQRGERESRRDGKRGRNDRGSGWAARPGMEGAEPAFLAD